jgi:ABC-type Zn uptake system ZnuABC Zn-binding protein ZnuA/ABC-type lipoprotein release transport system permease subunit
MISVCGVVVATIAMICTLSVFNGFKGLTSILFSVFDPELKITPVSGKVFDPATPEMKQVRELSEVEFCCEVLQENGFVCYGNRQGISVLKGVDTTFNKSVEIDTAIIDGEFILKEGDFSYAVVGIGLASTLGVNAAFTQPMEIYMPKRTGSTNLANPTSLFLVRYVFVGGVYYINQPVYDEGFMLVSIDLMRAMLDYDGGEVSALELKLTPGADVSSVKKRIAQLIGNDFIVRDRYEQQELSFNMIQIEKWVAYLMLCFILVLALFNVLGSLAILMIEKEADIIKLRNMGANNRLINKIFLFEGWMISLLGAVIGVVLGILLCLLQKYFGLIPLGETAGTFVIDAYPIEIVWMDVLTVFVTVIALGFLAVLYPVHHLGKKWFNNTTVACLLLPFVMSCGVKNKDPKAGDVKEIAVTIEPLRYFAEQIAGDRYRFFSVVPVGQSPETYDPSPREMMRVGNGVAYFHIGRLGFEPVMVHFIRENNANAYPFDLSDGMVFHEDACSSHDHDSGSYDHNHGHDGHDPHIWTSFKGAKVISENILKALTSLDKENQPCYQSNYSRLVQRLDSLEETLHKQLENLSCRSFVIYHPALTYFADEFGLKQYSIENDGKEPSPALLKRLIEETNAEKVGIVFVQMEFDRKHAEQIAREIDAKTVIINPLDYQWDKQMEIIAKALAGNGKTD